MKKTLLITFLLLAFIQPLFAQQAIAKIKYEEAEEAYAANNFELTVTKLSEAEVLLTSTNPRIMYLKIMAHSKILEQNSKLTEYSQLRILTEKYLKEYENLPDNEDKYRDVYKASEKLKTYSFSNEDFIVGIRKAGQIYQGKKDYKNALYYYNIAAEKGDDTAYDRIGRMYYYSYGVQTDYLKAFEIFSVLAKKNNAMAEQMLGNIYRYGRGQKTDYKLAFRFYEMSANQGYDFGQYCLGICYDSGIGCNKDINMAVTYYQLASNQKQIGASYHLGIIYYNGDLGTKDYVKAEKYFRIAENFTKSKYYLGLMYFNGEGVTKDWVEADKNFREVVSGKYIEELMKKDATSKLAEIYRTGGFGVTQDEVEAKKWEQ